MPRNVRLGTAEEQTLEALFFRGGAWTDQDPPLWDNRYWTHQLLNALARKGHVVQGKDGTYRAVPPQWDNKDS
jgi:hypothetical protein